jgi:hypothetical protein
MNKRKFADGGETTAEEKLAKYINVPTEFVNGRIPAATSKLPAASSAARLAGGEPLMENSMRDYAAAEAEEGNNLRPFAKKVLSDERQKISELADQYKRETRGKLAKGGTVRSSASKRADGIAVKGHTRGKYL